MTGRADAHLTNRRCVHLHRSLEQFHRIWQEKGHLMPVPDHLVCGVGTRIYSRQAGVEGWVEDAAWTSSLDGNGWDVEILLEVIAELTQRVGASW